MVVVDPAEANARPLLKLLESFYVHTAPLHMGVVYVVPTDPKITGLTDPSLAILIAVNYVTEAKDAASALSFVTEVCFNSKLCCNNSIFFFFKFRFTPRLTKKLPSLLKWFNNSSSVNSR